MQWEDARSCHAASFRIVDAASFYSARVSSARERYHLDFTDGFCDLRSLWRSFGCRSILIPTALFLNIARHACDAGVAKFFLKFKLMVVLSRGVARLGLDGRSFSRAAAQRTSQMTEPGWAGSAPPDEKPDWLKAAPPPAASDEAARSQSDTPSAPDEEWPAAAETGSRVSRTTPSAASFSLHDLTLNFFQPLCVSEPILRKVLLL